MFLRMAGPPRQPAKKILCGRCSTVLAHGLPLNRGSFNEELVAVLLSPTNLRLSLRIVYEIPIASFNLLPVRSHSAVRLPGRANVAY
jgi:hypothetical protein